MLVVGVDLALAWRDTNPLYVLGGVLLGGLAGEALRLEDRLAARRRPRCRRALTRGGEHSTTVSEAFFTASLLFCVGPLAVVGPIQDGLTGDHEALATKALLDGFASIALAASLGCGRRASRRSASSSSRARITLGAGLFEHDPGRGQRGPGGR